MPVTDWIEGCNSCISCSRVRTGSIMAKPEITKRWLQTWPKTQKRARKISIVQIYRKRESDQFFFLQKPIFLAPYLVDKKKYIMMLILLRSSVTPDYASSMKASLHLINSTIDLNLFWKRISEKRGLTLHQYSFVKKWLYLARLSTSVFKSNTSGRVTSQLPRKRKSASS